MTFRLLGDSLVAPSVASALGVGGLAGIVPWLALVLGLALWAIATVAASGDTDFPVATVVAIPDAAPDSAPYRTFDPPRARPASRAPIRAGWLAAGLALVVATAIVAGYGVAFPRGGAAVERPYSFVRGSVIEAQR